MAHLFPQLEIIKKINPRPGLNAEIACVQFLKKSLSDEFEIYFQPFINGDNPDIVLLRKGYGLLIIEVKEWELKKYYLDKKNNWRLKKNNQLIKSPIQQVKQYKENLYNLHIPDLLEKKINDKRFYRFVQTAVYFHEERQETIDSFVNTDRYCSLIGNDSLNESEFNNIINKHYLNTKSPIFDGNLYKDIVRFLQPPFHAIEGINASRLRGKQVSLSKSISNKQQKIKGVAGSGKTFVLAQRAVNSHIRHKNKVLILTFNIALKNYIHDRISSVRENFSWDFFYIDNYHNFIKSQTNNLNISLSLGSYDDIELFAGHENNITKFNSIFIDEIQDYRTEWIKIIKDYFLHKNGEFVVFGDEKQNIYDRKLDDSKKPNTTISGQWATLNQSFRLNKKIADLATKFQSNFFARKYSIDSISTFEQQEMFESINYYNISNRNTAADIADLVFKVIREKNIHSNDVCILASNIGTLRGVDYEIRKNEKTKTTFETLETFKSIEKTRPEYLNKELKNIRRSKKFNFWMNPGTMKLSTTHSFKGWEIKNLFLIINNNETNDELIYTAITRCIDNLFIINIENKRYESFFKNNINSRYLDEIKSPSTNEVKAIKTTSQKDIEKEAASKTLHDLEKEEENLENNFLQQQYLHLINKLKGPNNKFEMCVLGEISGERDNFKKILNDFFVKHGVGSQEWNIDFWNNKDIKRKDVKSLRLGQSKYNLLITGQIHQHSSKGNKQRNLLSELMKPKYVTRIYGSKPQKKLTINNFIDKLKDYLSTDV